MLIVPLIVQLAHANDRGVSVDGCGSVNQVTVILAETCVVVIVR